MLFTYYYDNIRVKVNLFPSSDLAEVELCPDYTVQNNSGYEHTIGRFYLYSWYPDIEVNLKSHN